MIHKHHIHRSMRNTTATDKPTAMTSPPKITPIIMPFLCGVKHCFLGSDILDDEKTRVSPTRYKMETYSTTGVVDSGCVDALATLRKSRDIIRWEDSARMYDSFGRFLCD